MIVAVDECALPCVTKPAFTRVPAKILTAAQRDRDSSRASFGHEDTWYERSLAAAGRERSDDVGRKIGVCLQRGHRHANVDRAKHHHAVTGQRADIWIDAYHIGQLHRNEGVIARG